MNKSALVILTLCLMLCALFVPVTTVSATDTGWIAGNVYTGYYPQTNLQGVTVSVVGTSATTTTDASGNYNLSVAVGTYSVKYTKLNYQDVTKTSQTVTVNATKTINVMMSKSTGGIKGMVTDKSTTKGIYMAEVTYGTGILDYVFTDNTGAYSIQGVPVGSYTLNVTTIGNDYVKGTAKVTVTANTNVTQNFQLDPVPIYLVVKVYNGALLGLPDTTKPIAGATVKLDDKTQTTDATGMVNFTNLAKKSYNLTITKGGFEKYTYPTKIDMSVGSQSLEVGMVSKSSEAGFMGFVGIMVFLICVLPIIIIVIIIVVIVWLIMRRKKKKQQAMLQPAGMPPAGMPPAGAPPPQQPQAYQQPYAAPPPQQPQGYSQPPAPPGQYGGGYTPPPQAPGQYQQPPQQGY